MSYLPFRDNPDLEGIDGLLLLQIGVLVEDIEAVMLQHFHASECGCGNFKSCPHDYNVQPMCTDPEELVGLLVATGWIDADKLRDRKPTP